MSNKDVIVMLLCSYGYDRNIKIGHYKEEVGVISYDVYAEDKDGNVYKECNAEGIMFHIYCILDFMAKNKATYKSEWWNKSVNSVTNEYARAELLESWDKSDRAHKILVETAPILIKWRHENYPCKGCEKNEFTTGYKAALPHFHCVQNKIKDCEKIVAYNENYRALRKELRGDLG